MPAASEGWNFACPDWEARLKTRRSLLPDLPLDEDAARWAVDAFDRLRLPDVDGQPLLRDAAGDWQRDIVRPIFGSVDAQGVRHVGEVFALVPKKNSKTTGGAAIMLTALVENVAPRQEFLLTAPTIDVADLAYEQAVGMIDADEEGYLKKRFMPRDHIKTIEDLRTKSELRIKTFDMKVMVGSKPKGVLVDEEHVLASFSYANRVMGQIRGGLIQRADSFLIIITTQSDEPPSGCFRADLQLARAIRDGRVKGEAARMLPILYEFPEAMQTDPARPWADPDNWPMVLPNLGRSIQLPRLRQEFATAIEKGEEEVRRWASQHLNVEIGMALHSARWRGADLWEAAVEPGMTLDELLDRCEVAVVGIDGGGLDDLFGLCVAGRERASNRWLYWFHAWAHESVLELRKDIAERLKDFEADGDLTICTSATQDIEEVVDLVGRVKAASLLPEKSGVGLDPQGVGVLVDGLASIGLEHPQVVAVSQGFRLSSAVWSMERKLKDRMLVHAGSKLMAWCVGNAKAEQRGNAVLITKEAAGKAKIDPLVAGFNATKLLEANPVALTNNGGINAWLQSLRAAA